MHIRDETSSLQEARLEGVGGITAYSAVSIDTSLLREGLLDATSYQALFCRYQSCLTLPLRFW